VLLARQGDAEAFPRLPSLMASLVKFMHDAIATVIMVVPDGEKMMFEEAFNNNKPAELLGELLEKDWNKKYFEFFKKNCHFKIQVVSDSDLMSTTRERYDQLTPHAEKVGGGRGSGYRIQMLLKLAVAKVVQTPFYITMDQDVFASRLTRADELVVDGKAIYQGEGHGKGGLGRTQHREGWFESSERVFGNRGCHNGHPTLGVTPAILSTEIAKGMYAELERSYGAEYPGAKWDEILFELLQSHGGHDWTEYTLYWAYGCKAGVLDKLHVISPSGLRLYGYWGWNWGSKLNTNEAFKDTTVFSVLQSIAGNDGHIIAKDLASHLT